MTYIAQKTNHKEKEELLALLRKVAQDKGSFDALIDDLLTPAEIAEFAVRLQIVKRLFKNMTQRDISKELRISPATVNRGNRALNYGRSGFQKALSQ